MLTVEVSPKFYAYQWKDLLLPRSCNLTPYFLSSIEINFSLLTAEDFQFFAIHSYYYVHTITFSLDICEAYIPQVILVKRILQVRRKRGGGAGSPFPCFRQIS